MRDTTLPCSQLLPPVPDPSLLTLHALREICAHLQIAASEDPLRRLLLERQPVPAAQGQQTPALSVLLESGFARQEGEALHPQFQLQVCQGFFVFSDLTSRADSPDFVLPIGPASHYLARLAIRQPVGTALDLGCGSGIQALLAARHSRHVLATDINPRALAFTRLNAALNRVENIETAQGSLLQPAGGRVFDLILYNPPFILAPAHHSELSYAFTQQDKPLYSLLAELPQYVNPGGFAQVTLNWGHRASQPPQAPLLNSLRELGMDGLLLWHFSLNAWQYAHYWKQHPIHAADRQFSSAARWLQTSHWAAWLWQHGMQQVAFGSLSLRFSGSAQPWFRAEKVSGTFGDSVSDQLLNLFAFEEETRQNPHAGDVLEQRLSLERSLFPNSAQQAAAGVRFPLHISAPTWQVLELLDGRISLNQAIENAARAGGFELRQGRPEVEQAVRNLLRFGWLRKHE